MESPLLKEPTTGNLAKVQVLEKCVALLEDKKRMRILDVGCVGPIPLDLWRSLLSNSEYSSKFKLYGIDQGY